MNEELKTDLSEVLTFVTMTANPTQIAQYCAEHETTEEDLDASLKRLGEIVGMDAGIL